MLNADRHAKIVIIGGGAIGCSVAYQLALAGEKDVLLLEKLPKAAHGMRRGLLGNCAASETSRGSCRIQWLSMTGWMQNPALPLTGRKLAP